MGIVSFFREFVQESFGFMPSNFCSFDDDEERISGIFSGDFTD